MKLLTDPRALVVRPATRLRPGETITFYEVRR